MSRPATLAAWLDFLETLHPKSIAMGLDRVRAVHARLAAEIRGPVVTVAGTNGKGSTCALLDAILRCAGYRAGLYTSPHLLRYNERVRIAGNDATDAELIEAFNAV
jgi:dihydrofolate synthase/folylpolyglutamate synthase